MISYFFYESIIKGNVKCVQCSVFNLIVVFVNFFVLLKFSLFQKNIYLVFFFILGLVDFYVFDFLRKLYVIDSFFRFLL